MQVYVVEMQLVTSEIDAYEEVADYTTAEMFRFKFNRWPVQIFETILVILVVFLDFSWAQAWSTLWNIFAGACQLRSASRMKNTDLNTQFRIETFDP